MPLSELYQSTKRENQSSPQKLTDISYIPNDEFVELIWEKGQVMMQGQSSKARKSPVTSNFQFHAPKVQGKDSMLNVPTGEMGLDQDDDMVPWLNYPLDDYCADLLPEISGVTVHEPSMHNGMSVVDKRGNKDTSLFNGLDQANTSKGLKGSTLFSWPDPMVRSGITGIGSSNCRSKVDNVVHRGPTQIQGSTGRVEKMAQKQDSLLPPYTSSTLLNFSHFSRPAAMAKTNNLQNTAANVVNHGPQKEIGFVSQLNLDSAGVGSNPFASKPLNEPLAVEKSSNVVLDVNGAKGVQETVKSNEPVVATSSVCSGNSAERASNDISKNSKRKFRDTEEFECQSQDVDEESLGTKTAGTSRGGTGSKRSRAAEVHNLSERRRRDRINEKMRALQELIPNCNKVDKASMLDEAIEYLKTLQLQVQIMSMGSRLCMSPIMFPGGMHPHFSPMGIGMGMGYGMGMEMNQQGHPNMFQFPPNTQGSRHPLPSPTVYGHPSQGMPMLFPQQPMPRVPMHPAARQVDVVSSSKDPMQTKNSHAMTQLSNQDANKTLNQSTLVDKKDQGLEAGCSTTGVD